MPVLGAKLQAEDGVGVARRVRALPALQNFEENSWGAPR